MLEPATEFVRDPQRLIFFYYNLHHTFAGTGNEICTVLGTAHQGFLQEPVMYFTIGGKNFYNLWVELERRWVGATAIPCFVAIGYFLLASAPPDVGTGETMEANFLSAEGYL
jgi:hypothetical protein